MLILSTNRGKNLLYAYALFACIDDDIKFQYELFELRYGRATTILVGQYPVKDWYLRLGGVAYADSILDRTVHNFVNIDSSNTNMRELIDSKKYM